MPRNRNDRPLVELCTRYRVTAAHVAAARPNGAEDSRTLNVHLIGISRPVALRLASTKQRIGRRWWWLCPYCGRRCAVLLREHRSQDLACRRCLGAAYFRDNPSMRPYVASAQLFGWVPGPFDHWQQIAFLVERRRRGVRRGRRLRQRAGRLLACAPSLTQAVNPDVARFAKWYVDESRLQAAFELAGQRRQHVRARPETPAPEAAGGRFPGQAT